MPSGSLCCSQPEKGLQWFTGVPETLLTAIAFMVCNLEPACTHCSRVGAHRPCLGVATLEANRIRKGKPQLQAPDYFRFSSSILPGIPDISLPNYPWLCTAHSLKPGSSVLPQSHASVATSACFRLSPRIPRSGGGGLRPTCASVSQGSREHENVTPPVCLRLVVR